MEELEERKTEGEKKAAECRKQDNKAAARFNRELKKLVWGLVESGKKTKRHNKSST